MRLALYHLCQAIGGAASDALQAALIKALGGLYGLSGWRWLFMGQAILAMVWGIIGFFIIPDFSMESDPSAPWVQGKHSRISTQRLKRIADLESLLQRNNIPYDNQAVVPSEDLDMHTSTIQTSMQHVLEHNAADTAPNIGHAGPDSFAAQTIPDNILNLTQCSPGKEPAFSNNLLRRVVGAKLSPQTATPVPSQSLSTKGPPLSDLMREFESTQISPPSREAADNLVDVYFQFAQTGSPLLHEASFRRKLDVVYASPELMSRADERSDNDFKLAAFLVFAVLAVAIVIRQRREPRQALIALANSYHRMSLQFYQAAVLPNDMSDVVRLLLIAKFSYHHPEEWDVWKPIGAALRLAIELGLHKDQETTEPDALVLDMKRRVFWVAYTMDRSVAIGFNMPLGISDGAITTKFPSEVDDEFITPSGINDPKDGRFWSKRIGIHLLHYRRLQSEMHNMLYEKPWPANPTLDLGEWQSGMGDRLWKWYKECPVGNNLNNEARINLENFELSLYRALILSIANSLNTAEHSAGCWAKTSAAKHPHLQRRGFGDHVYTSEDMKERLDDGLDVSSAGSDMLSRISQSIKEPDGTTFVIDVEGSSVSDEAYAVSVFRSDRQYVLTTAVDCELPVQKLS
ncbi:Fungal specific transcription factor [Neopestalotiopsis sp. 37M]|nr:Fungal specific transcription factor [Neopestalotiopsis sp. 37M]